jgi:catechol 2,3-dioxygenase-like lactoylglutathione lyase family enzyme
MFLTILYVSNLARARAFYDGAFGFRTTVDVPIYVEYRVNAGARLGLMPQGNTRHFLGERLGKMKPRDSCPRGEIYLHVRNPKAVIARLEKLGAKCTSPWAKRDWGDFAAYFFDPDGYVLVVAKTAVARWR